MTSLLGAYESQGLFKQALTDIQQVNRTDAASTETKDIEKRLKDLVSGRRPPGLYVVVSIFKRDGSLRLLSQP